MRRKAITKSDILADSLAATAGRLSTWAEIRALWPLAAKHAWAAPVMVTLGLAASLAETFGISLMVLFLYTVMGKTTDAIQTGGLLGRVFEIVQGFVGGSGVVLGALIFLLIVAKALLSLVYGLITAFVRYELSERIRNKMHEQYLDVSYEYIRCHDQGDLINALSTQSWAVADAYYSVVRMAINACAIGIFGLFLIVVSWKITLIAALGSALLFSTVRILSKPVQRLGQVATEVNRELTERMLTTLQGMRTIRAFAQEEHDKQRFRSVSRKVSRTFLQLEWLGLLLSPIGEIGNLALLGLIVAASASLGISFAATLAAVALLYRLQPHIQELETNRLKLASMDASLAVVRSVLDRSNKVYLPRGDVPFEGVREGVRFEKVSITYPGALSPSLREASFTIRRGGATAIVGPSGAGKTTIVNLLLRLYQPDTGTIRVDGAPLDSLERSSWLSKVAVAGQDAELIDGTIAANIAMARPDASLAEIEAAAAAAGILDFIEAAPERFDTWVGERGLNLSGGQRQRIGVARAVLRNADIVILDEATSALEGGLEDEIRRKLQERLVGKTLIIITHRLETVLGVNSVISLDAGSVVEEGPPASLLMRPGSAFRRMRAREKVPTSW